MSSGVNIFEPVIERDADGKLSSLSIRQGMGLRGKNRLRLQRMDVGLYAAVDSSASSAVAPYVIKNVVVSATEELTVVDLSSLPADFCFGAIAINNDEHAYGKVRFDAESIDWLTENLHRIEDPLTRSTVWRYFWQLVMDRKMSSLKYVEFVQKQLPHETVDQTIGVALMNLKVLIAYYIPTELSS